MKKGIRGESGFQRSSCATAVALLAWTTMTITACGGGGSSAPQPPPPPPAVWDYPAGTSGILSLAVWGGTIYIGGTFTSVAGTSRNRLAAVDASSGVLLSWNPSVALSSPSPKNAQPCNPNLPTPPPALVCALAVVNSVVFAGGSFTSVAGESHDSLVAIEAVSGSVLPWNLNTTWNGAVGAVDALVASGNAVYVGGVFDEIGGMPRSSLAAVSASTGVVAAWNVGPGGVGFNGLSVAGGQLYFAGAGVPPGGLGSFDLGSGVGGSWPLGLYSCNFIGGLSNTPASFSAVVVVGDVVLASGLFQCSQFQINSPDPWAVGAFKTDHTQLKNINLIVSGTNSGISALAALGTTVYVAGSFTTIAGTPRNNLAAFDVTTGAILPWNPNANGQVTALTIQDGVVYVAGAFTSIGGATRYSLAKVDPTTGMVVQ